MHQSSMRHMQHLVEKHLASSERLKVADLGSYDVNGSYRPIFDRPGWSYIGIDLAPGPNVDVVLTSPYRFPLDSNSLDVIVSGQAFEHIEFFWLTWLEMARVIKPGGKIILIAPSRGPEHRFPVDCWRFYTDGFLALAKYASLDSLEVQTDWDPAPEEDSAPYGDTFGVFRKKAQNPYQKLRSMIGRRLRYWVMPGFR